MHGGVKSVDEKPDHLYLRQTQLQSPILQGVTKKRGTGLKKLPRAYLWIKIDQTFTQISPSTLYVSPKLSLTSAQKILLHSYCHTTYQFWDCHNSKN